MKNSQMWYPSYLRHSRSRLSEIIETQLRDETGSELVEFAFSIPILLGVLLLIVYGSLALYTAHFVANSSEEAARYASVRGSTWSGTICSTNPYGCMASTTDVSNYVTSSLPPGLSSSSISITTTWPGTNSTGSACDNADGNNSQNCLVEVTVSYNLNVIAPFAKSVVIPFSSTAEMTILR